MIISAGRRYIFAHIPKTGGTALALALEGRAMKDDVLIGDTPKAKKRRRRWLDVQTAGRKWKHSTLADIDGLVSRAQMADWFVLTLVRNPWDRMVSYYHWLQEQRFQHPAVALAKSRDFSDFLNDPTTIGALVTSPYAHYVTDVTGQMHGNLFARLEHLQEDLSPFWAHLGFQLDVPVVNASVRPRDWRCFYSDADAALVSRLCAADIMRSGYRFDV